MPLPLKLSRPLNAVLLPAAAAGLLLGSALPVLAQTYNNTIFGPNVYVFDPSVPGATINSTLDAITKTNPSDNAVQFGTNRAAVLFKPGTYNGVSHQMGFYLSAAGLGQTPDAVTLNGGGLYIDATDASGNVTTNFWRSIENVTIPIAGGTERWAVSQGAAFRRMHVQGYLELTNQSCGYASGGFISDSKVEGVVQACSQQQWYSRNSQFGCTAAFPCRGNDASLPSFTGGVWNYVFSGVNFQNPVAQTFPTPPNTVLPTTPISKEKPFLYVDGTGGYNVFVPALQTNSSGITWASGGLGAGTTLPISSFFIATPSNTVQQINAALAGGKNLILTPGIYKYAAPIAVTNPNTVVLGLGYPTLIPQSGNAALTVADVDGAEVAAVLIDAGPVNSPVLMQVGNAGGARANHTANPTTIFDTYFRIGGAEPGTATTSLEIDSNNVLMDNIWAWRADHGAGVGWNVNTADHGLVVNGDNVTALGLAVEHYQKSQVQWNGNKGETIFYQSEDPYDPPSQSAWMDGTMLGYPSYEVTANVCQHTGYGIGVYSFFNQGVDIHQSNAIVVPNVTGITMTHDLIVKLTGSGDIDHIINGVGGPASSHTSNPIDLNSYTGSGTCTATTPQPAAGVLINAGGGAAAPYLADQDFNGGSVSVHNAAIDLSGVVNPAPLAVYQTSRLGTFSYTVGGLTPNAAYTVRLHFAETYWTAAGKRQFNIAVSGTTPVTNFDVYAAAGAKNKAVVLPFSTTADKTGTITVTFSRGATDQPEVCGIDIE